MGMTMKNKRPLILLLLACCLAQPVFGQTGFGLRDCGQWIARTDGTGKRGVELWLSEYLTGLNAGHWLNQNNDDPLKKINSVDQIYLWMDNYCKKNPFSTIGVGGLQLLIELQQKK